MAGPSHLIRKALPSFSNVAVMPDQEFKTLTNKDFEGSWTVLFSYPLDFTFVCPTEIIAFSDRAAEFEAIGCKVAAFSVDSHFSHLAWIQTPRSKGGLGKMNIPVIADISKSLSKSLGCLIEDPADGDNGVTLRATYIIDPKGNVRSVQMNDLPVGRSVDEVLRIVQAFQYVEKHGEVCPAGWKPGAATMKADPKGSKAYFEAANKAQVSGSAGDATSSEKQQLSTPPDEAAEVKDPVEGRKVGEQVPGSDTTSQVSPAPDVAVSSEAPASADVRRTEGASDKVAVGGSPACNDPPTPATAGSGETKKSRACVIS